jgi:hypothetical protein
MPSNTNGSLNGSAKTIFLSIFTFVFLSVVISRIRGAVWRSFVFLPCVLRALAGGIL